MRRPSLWQEVQRRSLRPIWYLGGNRLSRVGVILTTATAITLISMYSSDYFGVHLGPYVGIFAYLILPTIFVAGLLLIPLGMWLKRRREIISGELPREYPKVDLGNPLVRETVWFVAVMTGINAAILLTATYRGIHYMDSVQFCGLTCHSVMHPEYAAYQRSPHARVPCVECHIGPGAPWFVRSKLSGVAQVFSVALDLYPRPIPTPIEDLRPSRDTCEQCHWPLKFVGHKLVVKTHYAEDEANTESRTVMVMRIGGLDPLTGRPRGNHGIHLQPGTQIHYIASDPQRQEIPYVRYRRPDGEVIEYVAPGKPAAAWREARPLRLMDCMDCHNRPTHTFELPGAALDKAFTAGLLDRSLPYLKKEALRILQADHPSHAEAAERIRSQLRNFYRANYPQVFAEKRAAIEKAGDVLVDLYTANVFPEMRLSWGAYPNNLGHENYPGCFRCHDGMHSSADGDVIPVDCETCHEFVSFGEREAEILKSLSE